MDTNLSNKTALVTGASRGMGRAIALALAAAGAHVIVHYGRNAEQAKAVVDEIRREGGRADQVASDLAAPDGPHALAAQVRKLIDEPLDILVLNAGISNSTPFESMTVEDFDALFAVNVRTTYFLVQQFLPILGNGSNIIFLSSLGARAAVGTGLCQHEGSRKHAGQIFRRAAWPSRYPRQRRGAWSHRYRHVAFHKD
jgi:3-oxoacyl-[acyl-carrier protein] reductase